MLGKKEKPTMDDLCRFFRIIRRKQKAGIMAQQCLEQYESVCTKPALKSIAQSLLKDLGSGATLADALRKHTFFPSFVIELVAVGERTGQLSEFLNEIVFFLEQENDIQKELRSSLIKFFCLIGLAFTAFLIAGFVVIPRIGDLLMSLGTEIPYITQVIVSASTMLQNNWFLLPIMAFLMLGFYIYTKKEHPEKIDYLKLHLPFIGTILSMEVHYKFCKIISLCSMTGDIPVHKSFQFTSMAIDNALMKTALQRAAKDLELSGSQPANALEKADVKHVLSEDLYIMMKSGKDTGQLSDILSDEAEEYRKAIVRLSKEVGNKINSTVVIPIMVFIFILVISVYAPLFNMMEAANA